ncbi:MOSC domain-containing protein [Thiomicrorhabdus cannonii]|uniref:MOSC domain-containing protein n=1 Tax=Thiomicrorhabdus cannonii TaxID=2748011 RepID=UPI0015C0EEB2|nr:MOSC domain-containing protein [Thiomicrorhabdus cannonii]
MRVESINVGAVETLRWRDGEESGVHPRALHGLVRVNKTGLEGDSKVGKPQDGEDKAVFVMPAQAYERLGLREPFGFLGENLTISGLDERQVCLGDHLRIGSVLLEVSQPRAPCWNLDEQEPNAYSQKGCVGFYCRVLQEGLLHKGDSVTVEPYSEALGRTFSCITVYDLYRAKLYHHNEKEWLILQSVVKHPALAEAWRKAILELLKIHSAG